MNVPLFVTLRHLRILVSASVAFSLLPLCAETPKRYALILSDEPVARHVASREQLQSAAGLAYRRQIESTQAALRAELADRQIAVAGSASTVLNAVFVVASPERAAELRSLPGVTAVVPLRSRFHRNLNRATQLVNAPAAWAALGGLANAGRGMKIGIIDTGIDQTHPTFDPSGFTMPAGFPICNPGTTGGKPDYSCADFTTNKVIVARSYVHQLAAGTGPADSRPDDYTPRDLVGHGTAIASVAAGETASGVVTINGMAPGAWLGNYRIWGSDEVNSDNLPDDVIISALDDAVRDGMDVISFSTGGPAFSAAGDTTGTACGTNQVNEGICPDLVAIAFQNAASMKNGPVIVVAAGNQGENGTYPSFNTISSPANEPAVLAVGGTTNSHYFITTVTVPSDPALQNIVPQVGDGFQYAGAITAPVVDVTAAGNSDGLLCSALPAGSLNGDIALIERGTCDFVTKVTNAQNADAIGVIFYMADSSTPIAPGGLSNTFIPAVMISNAQGLALKSFLATHPLAAATIDPSGSEQSSTTANQVVGFSSLGPSLGDNAIKPDLVAVAGNEDPNSFFTLNSIYMAAQSYDFYGGMYSSNRYLAADGTSFATPMVAGAAALVKQKHPNYTAAEIRSALVNTASQNVTTDNSTPPNPVDVQWVGGGLLNAGAAVNATVTVSPTTLSFGAFTSTLPSSQTVTVTNNGASAVSLTAAPQSGGTVTVTSGSLTLAPGASGAFTVQVAASAPKTAGEYSGGITISGSGVSLRVPYMYLIPNGAAAQSPNLIPLSGDFFDGTVNGGIPDGVLSFMVVDDFGVPIANQAVTWTATTGSGKLINIDTTTNAYGIATAQPVLGAAAGNYSYTANVSGLSVNHTFSGTARTVPAIRAGNGVLNAASFTSGGIAPGSYIAIFGSGLSDFTDMTHTARLPLGLDFAYVSFDVPSAGISVPGRLTYVSPTQVNVQVPWELQGQTSVQMKVGIDYTYGNVVTVPVATYSPAFFVIGGGNVAALDLNYHVIGTNNPAVHGKVVQLYANGLGPVSNQPVSGDPAPSTDLARTTTTPIVMIGGQQADVSFSGLAPGYAGLYQINATVPAGLAPGTYPITVAMGGVTSPAANIVVQ